MGPNHPSRVDETIARTAEVNNQRSSEGRDILSL